MIIRDSQLPFSLLESRKTAYGLLVKALKQDISKLHSWLWKYQYPTDIYKYKKELGPI
ncbi:hypothetical protein CLU79DRAFT_771738 [Phycomyces nitens]|nr:hypothetical protein CLU79DRAFT_771738 [Phycomyces nitens]